MEEIYKNLHKHNEDWVKEKRRARDYQAACFEKNEALMEALAWLDKSVPQDVYDKIVKALEA
jgi:hypothetical protein